MKRVLLAGLWLVLLGSLATAELGQASEKVEAPLWGTNADVLLLNSGETLTGSFLEQTLALHTAYGELTLDKQVLSTVAPSEGPQGLVCVTTVNSNRFSGLLQKPFFTFQPRTGDCRQVRWEKVLRLTCTAIPNEGVSFSPALWVELKNGDKLSGELLVKSLPIVTPRGKESVAVADIAAVVLSTFKSTAASINLRDGQHVEAVLALEVIPLQLALGPELQLDIGRIARLGSEMTRAAGNLVPSVGAAAGQTQTNLEGLVWVPPGEFLMGSPGDETGRNPDEGPQTRVIFRQGFWMGRCEVTQAEFQRVMGSNPSSAADDPARPVEKVTWFEAQEYCGKLTQRAEAEHRLPDDYAYRLPTEAEWEYACRAGSTTRFCYGEDKADVHLDEYAWFTRNSDSTTHPVGSKRANAWGLHDMHGNVWEWCLDHWEGVLPGGIITNRAVVATGNLRAARGGSWLYDGKACRSADRDTYSPWNRCSDVGFRVVLARMSP